jgi:membrane protease subunit (stomatin/prohibitin family)
MFDVLKKQFVDVIDWLETPGQLAWRVPFADREIQNGAQLTVREGQVALFYDEGQLADRFEAGLHTLDTSNLPVLSSLLNWDKAFKSPFKSDVVFLSLKEQAGFKWGTPQPVTVRDVELGPLRIRAFGTMSFAIADVEPFVARVLGTMGEVTVESLAPQLRSAINTAMATALGGSGIAFLDLAANQQALSDRISVEVGKALAGWGLACTGFLVESLSLPEEVQRAMDKGSAMRALGDLDRYAKFQAAQAIETAAAQDGGMAAVGAGLAAATALGGVMAHGLAPIAGTAPAEDPFALIEKLHKLLTMGAISQSEFDAKKAELLARVR